MQQRYTDLPVVSDLWTLKAAAQALGVSLSRLRRYVDARAEVHLYRVGKTTLVRLRDLEDMPR